MQIKGRQRVVVGKYRRDDLEIAQQWQQRGLGLKEHPSATRRDQRHITAELQGIAQPLLGIQQHGLATQVGTGG